MSERDKSEIKIFASICIFYALFMGFLAFIGLSFSAWRLTLLSPFEIFALFESPPVLISSLGLLFYASWARKLLITVSALALGPLIIEMVMLITRIREVPSDPFYGSLATAIILLLHLGSIYYLRQGGVKAQFQP